MVDIYRAAKRQGKYPTLATDTDLTFMILNDYDNNVLLQENMHVRQVDFALN